MSLTNYCLFLIKQHPGWVLTVCMLSKLCVYLHTCIYACVRSPELKLLTWIGKVRSGFFSVEIAFGGEWRITL